MKQTFRAWDTVNKKWVNPALIALLGNGTILRYREDGRWVVDYSGTIVIQFSTGLKDKNGVEIYEGDVVSHFKDPNGYVFPEPYQYQIVWSGSGFTIQGKAEIPASFLLDEKWSDIVEVIGNIYESATLLPTPTTKDETLSGNTDGV